MVASVRNRKKRAASPPDSQSVKPSPKRQNMEQASTLKEKDTPPAEQKQASADKEKDSLLVPEKQTPATSQDQAPTQAGPWHEEMLEKYMAERDVRLAPVLFAVDRYRKYQRGLWNFVSQNDMKWILPMGLRQLSKDLAWFRLRLDGWLHYSAISCEELQGLSDAQKRLVVSSLKGSLVQDDLDTTMSLLPNHIRNGFASILLQSYIAQHAFTKMFTNPFWYFDSEAEQLNQLYGKFIQTSKAHAALWRCDKIRLANSVKPNMADDLTLGQSNQERRDAAVTELAAEIFSSEVFKLLMKPFANAEEEAADLKDLAFNYKILSDMQVKLFAHPSICRVCWMDDLEDTFTIDRETMAASPRHFLDPGEEVGWETRLVGHASGIGRGRNYARSAPY